MVAQARRWLATSWAVDSPTVDLSSECLHELSAILASQPKVLAVVDGNIVKNCCGEWEKWNEFGELQIGRWIADGTQPVTAIIIERKKDAADG